MSNSSIPAPVSRVADPSRFSEHFSSFASVNFHEAVEAIFNSSSPGGSQVPRYQVRLPLSPILDGFAWPELCVGRHLFPEESSVWLSCANSRTPLHRDDTDAFLIHLLGAKSAVLISPSEWQRVPSVIKLRQARGSLDELYGASPSLMSPLIQNAAGRTLPLNKPHDPVPPTFVTIPSVQCAHVEIDSSVPPSAESLISDILQASRVERWRVSLTPGDMLYIPRDWLHDVESATPCVSISLRTMNGPVQSSQNPKAGRALNGRGRRSKTSRC